MYFLEIIIYRMYVLFFFILYFLFLLLIFFIFIYLYLFALIKRDYISLRNFFSNFFLLHSNSILYLFSIPHGFYSLLFLSPLFFYFLSYFFHLFSRPCGPRRTSPSFFSQNISLLLSFLPILSNFNILIKTIKNNIIFYLIYILYISSFLETT